MDSLTEKFNCLHYSLKVNGSEMEQEILKPFKYMTTVPGKRIRQNLLKVLGHWTTIPEDKLAIIEEITHYIHNGSLLLDDIQDYSALRRGVPAAHTVFGVSRTTCAVTYVQAIVCGLCEQLNDLKTSQMYCRTLPEIFAGQGMELYWRDNHICPTEAQYIQMIYRKTGLVFLTAHKAVNAVATSHRKVDASKLLTTLGMYFQINDDYQNLNNKFYFDSKGFCEDITEGKFSYPVVHAINNFPEEGKIIMNILRQRTQDIGVKKYCVSILKKCGSFEYTKNKLQELKDVIYGEVGKLDQNPFIDEFIDKAMITCL